MNSSRRNWLFGGVAVAAAAAGAAGAWWRHGLAGNAGGETLDAEPAFGPTGGLYTNPGYAVFNLGGSWRIVRKVEIFARAMNLFDRHYEEVFGYPAPGRTGYVGARVAVGR